MGGGVVSSFGEDKENDGFVFKMLWKFIYFSFIYVLVEWVSCREVFV